MRAWIALLLLCAPVQESKYLIADPSAPQRVDYLVIAGDDFAGRLDELAAYRAKQGHLVGIVKMSALRAKFESVEAFLAHVRSAWKKPAPKFLLLVGDVDQVPAVVRNGSFTTGTDKDLATDFDYACAKELEPELHVGRFPCDTADELAIMIRKTIDYETKLPDGAWQKRVNFIAGKAGYGDQMDAAIEKAFIQVVAGGIPNGCDIEVAYGNPKSPYCPFPPRFNDNALRLVNEGSLLCVYVGHGATTGVASVIWKGEAFPVLGKRDAKRVDVKEGLPVMIVLACSTGEIDAKTDCIAEEFVRVPRGPVAFLAGSRITTPYGNALLGEALATEFFSEAKTLGEVLTRAKLRVLKHEKSLFNQQADFLGAQQVGIEALEPMRHDVVRHYNLLGDPALLLRRPAADLKLALADRTLSIEAPATQVDITLECARESFAHPIEKKLDDQDPELGDKMDLRYRNANDKVLKRWTVKLEGGKGTLDIEIPTEPGKYVLKAFAPGRIGSTPLQIKP